MNEANEGAINLADIPFSLAHLSAIDLTPPELIMAAHDAGYKFIGLRMVAVTPDGPGWDLWRDKATMASTKSRMGDTGVGVLDVELIKMLPDTDVTTFLPCMEASAELGARHLLTQADDPETSRVIDNYGKLCDLAADFSLTCDMEFIPWIHTATLADVKEILFAANRPNCGICIDTLHYARAGTTLDELSECPPEWFHYVQLCDAPAAAPKNKDGLIYAAREERLFPGEGELDILGIMNRLPFPLVIGIEIPAETLSFTASPAERARMAREATLKVFREGGYPSGSSQVSASAG